MTEIEKVVKYDAEVWSNTKMDELRSEECLCFNCAYDKDSCKIAEKIYNICVEDDMAMMITRCKNYSFPEAK